MAVNNSLLPLGLVFNFSTKKNESVDISRRGNLIIPKQTELDFIMRLITYPTCSVAGLLGNLFVIAIIVRRKKSNRSNIYETFLLNLALTDCGVLLIQFLPGVIIGPLLQWNIGRFACYFVLPLGDSFLPASSLTLLTISLVRYRAIMYPFKPKLSEKMSLIIILIIWTVSLILGTAPMIKWLKARDIPGEKMSKCQYAIPWTHRMLWFTGVFIVLFLIPLIVIWTIYFRLRKRLFEALDDLSGVLKASAKDSKRATENRKAIKMILIVTVLFMILYLPFFVSTYLHFFLNHTSRILRVTNEIALFLVCFNSVVNPIVYCVVNKSYRRELCIMLTCRKNCRKQKGNSPSRPIATFSKPATVEVKVSISSNWV